MRLDEIETEYDVYQGRLEPSNIESAKTIRGILNKKCSDTIKVIKQHNLIPYWRGTKSSGATGPFGYYEPAKFVRKSRNTQNYYNLIFQSIPSWKGWPDRTKSIVGSSSYSYAAGYGKAYAIFPVNGATIAWGRSQDFWNDFPHLTSSTRFADLDDFNYELRELSKVLEIPIDEKDKNQFLKDIKLIEKKLIALKRNVELYNQFQKRTEERYRVRLNAWMNMIPFMKTFNNLFDPAENEIFKFQTSHVPYVFMIGGKEWWSEGPMFAVSSDILHNVLNGIEFETRPRGGGFD